MQKYGYDTSVVPDPISYESAVMKPVPQTLARDVFHAIKVTQNRLHRAPVTDQSVVKIEESLLSSHTDTVSGICDWIQKNTQEHEDIIIEMEFLNAHMYYSIMLICLLTYRARWPSLSLPIIWIIDSNLPPLPANYSKAFVWRYQTRRVGSMSGKLLEFGISSLKSLYSEHAVYS